MDAAVIVLNADLGPLHRVSLRHAIRMLCRKVAEIHESEPDIRIGVFPRPISVKLLSYINPRWRYTAGPGWSANGVLRRDNFVCAFCGGRASTIDHLVPRSHGGRNTWLNTVSACYGCNQAKGARTPEQARMTLRYRPSAPTWASLAQR
jgi:hypothetical protein